MTARHSVEHSDRGTKSGQVSQEFTVVTSAPQRAFATAALGLAFAGSVVLFGGAAWADPTPAPATAATAEPVAPSDAPEAPATQPSIGSWIVGGTLQEGTAGAPAANPAAKPAANPAAVQPVRHTTSTTT